MDVNGSDQQVEMWLRARSDIGRVADGISVAKVREERRKPQCWHVFDQFVDASCIRWPFARQDRIRLGDHSPP